MNATEVRDALTLAAKATPGSPMARLRLAEVLKQLDEAMRLLYAGHAKYHTDSHDNCQVRDVLHAYFKKQANG